MDDLALIGSKFFKLQKNINLFLDFLHMNQIKCNNKKTQIIYTGTNFHPNHQKSFTIGSISIPTLPYKDHLKYLGCYFSGFNSSLATAKQTVLKITQVKKAILHTNWNGLISKQVAHWIIPAYLEYGLYIFHFGQSSINLVQRTINSICKTKYHLERTTPNSFINSPISLNVINIEHKYQKVLTKLLLARLANPKTSSSIKNEIRSLQTSHNIWKCPLCNPHLFKKNWITIAANILQQFKIHSCPNPCPFESPFGNYSLGLLSNMTKAQDLRADSHNLHFLNDVLEFQSHRLLQWHQLKIRTMTSQ